MNLTLAILFLSHLYRNFYFKSAFILTHKKCIEAVKTRSLMLASLLRFSNIANDINSPGISHWEKY